MRRPPLAWARRGLSARAGLLTGLAALALAAPPGCGGKEKTPAPAPPGKTGPLAANVLAQVNEAQITEADLQRLIPPEIRDGITGAEIRDILDRWVRTELLYQKAKQDGLDADKDVAARLHDLQRELLADEMLQHELGSRVRVSSDDLQTYYRTHLAQYTQELWLKQILVDSREEAEEIVQLLRNGANFEELARQRSIDASNTRGGDLGYLGKGAMNPAFEAYVFSLQPGEYAGPIATTFGFHVVKVAGKRPAADPIGFEAARDEIFHNLLLQKQQAAQAEFLRELRGGSRVQIATSYAGLSLTDEVNAAPAPGTGNTRPRGAGRAGRDSLPSGQD